MASPIHNHIEQAYAELERRRAELEDVQETLRDAQTTVLSKNRALQATVDSRGALTGLKFLTTGFRTMAGAELAQLIVDTVEEARAAAMATTVERFRAILPASLPLQDMLAGTVDLDRILSDAARFADDTAFGGPGR